MRMIFAVICAGILLFSCKKESTGGESFALFKMTHFCGYQPMEDTLKYIDSTIFFNNSSTFDDPIDSNAGSNFKWDFGDGNFSTAINPTHKYSQPGTYTITLTTYVNGKPSSTWSRTTDLLCGQRQIKPDETNLPIDMAQAASNGGIILSSGRIGANAYNYYISRVNNNLQTLWTKKIASNPGETFRYNSIRRIDDVSFVLSGYYGDETVSGYSVSKIDNSGNLLWRKNYPDIPGYNTHAIPTSDGGFVSTGVFSTGDQTIVTILKLNSSGDEVWRKNLYNVIDDFYKTTILEVNNSYVLATCQRQVAGGYPLLITKLGQSGQVIQQDSSRKMEGEFNNTSIAYSNNRYMVTGSYSRLYFYDENLSFLSVNQMTDGSTVYAEGYNGFFYTATKSDYRSVKKLSPSGEIVWFAMPKNTLQDNCSSYSTGSIRPSKSVMIVNNEVWALSHGLNRHGSGAGTSVFLEKFSLDGAKR